MKEQSKADKYFSLYIRKLNSVNDYCVCITCGRSFHWKNIDCGHFISRAFQATRYDEKNVSPQCKHCNRFSQGVQFQFSLAIDKKYGAGMAEKLLMKSKMYCKRNRYDYEFIADMYRGKFNALK